MKKLVAGAMLMLAMVCFSAICSEAGVRKIRPDQLLPMDTSFQYFQTPSMIFAIGSYAQFYAVVKLPVGKTIKKLTYYHKGWGSPVTIVTLNRSRMGEADVGVATKSENDSSSTVIPVVTTDIDPAYKKIKRGYTYYVYVYSKNEDSEIHGIEIYYK